MPRRSKDRRTSSLDSLTAKIDRVAGARPCIAVITESVDEPGVVYFAAMLCPPGTCPARRCDDARARLRPWPAPPTPAPLTDQEKAQAGFFDEEEI